jgi:hypothetical protein
VITKIFVTSNLQASVSCPECGNKSLMDVSKFVEHKAEVRLKYKCKCKHSFTVLLERRNFVRKKKNLKGHLIVSNSIKYPITIADISRLGVKIQILEKLPLNEGDKIKIEFILDDANRSKVSKMLCIKKIISITTMGCEFVSSDHYGALGKYFLFNV